MADEDRENKTEEPTPKRLAKAREEGEVAKSVELTSALVLLAGFLATGLGGRATVMGLGRDLRRVFARIPAGDLVPAEVSLLTREAGAAMLRVALPVLAATALVAVVASVAQIGFGLYPKRIQPKGDRLLPSAGLQRIFSRQGLLELVKSVLKIALVSWLGWRAVLGVEPLVRGLSLTDGWEIVDVAGVAVGRMIAWVGTALGLLAALDYAFQRYEHRQSLRMSRQEVKDEARESDGDPQIKQRMRKAYREWTANKMLADVSRADVVVTNPVHLAVALRYAPGEMSAPVVVAKGAGPLAERIKTIARQNGIAILERRALARALFRQVEVGDEIPAALYRAIAEILAYIYSLRERRAG